jgi:hypothetical protein
VKCDTPGCNGTVRWTVTKKYGPVTFHNHYCDRCVSKEGTSDIEAIDRYGEE